MSGESEPDAPRPKSRLFEHWRSLSWFGRIAALPVYFYRLFISPLLGRNCRFEPTCSVYALEALSRHGAIRGTWLALRRLSRCHPFEWLGGGGSGYDPVPERRRDRASEPAAESAAKEAEDGR